MNAEREEVGTGERVGEIAVTGEKEGKGNMRGRGEEGKCCSCTLHKIITVIVADNRQFTLRKVPL